VLSRTEWQLLQQLCANAGRVMLHEDLLTRTWGPEYRNDLQYLRVWISRLRQKLEANPAEPRYIRTVQGIGYILEARPNTTAQVAAI
jgi:two-component system KDP operon response regulator KdpE